MYRAVTAYLLRFDKLDASEEEMAEAARGMVLVGDRDGGDRLVLHGEDVTGDIRTPRVTAEVSRWSIKRLV